MTVAPNQAVPGISMQETFLFRVTYDLSKLKIFIVL